MEQPSGGGEEAAVKVQGGEEALVNSERAIVQAPGGKEAAV